MFKCSNEAHTDRCPIDPIADAVSSKNLNLKELGKSICKLHWEAPFDKKFGTGFFCKFVCSGVTIEGIFTCCHVINCIEEFIIKFQLIKLRIPIQPNDVKWIYTDRKLDITFIAFTDTMTDFIKNRTLMLSVASSNQITAKMHVTVLQHPEGKDLSVSEGEVVSFGEHNIRCKFSTLGGSSGAAIVNERSEVVAIHKQGGPITEVNSGKEIAEYNIGALISKAVDDISQAKPWNEPRWRKDVNGQIICSNLIAGGPLEASSLCLLSMRGSRGQCYGNGVLCRVTLLGNVIVYGLFTNKHILLRKPNPGVKFTINFATDNSNIDVQSSDVDWVHADDKLHFTFVAFTKPFMEKLKNQNRQFLSLAKTKISSGSKYILIQHLNDNTLNITEGLTKDYEDIYLYHEGSGRPQIHGSLILNDNSEVIALGGKCGWSCQLGTFITEDHVAKLIRGTYLNKTTPKTLPVKEMKNGKVLKSVAALCKIETIGLLKDKPISFTGFLCCVTLASNNTLKGLFTTYHGISYNQPFNAHFEKSNISVKVEQKHVQHFFCDKALGFTFISFKDAFTKELTDKRVEFLSLAKEQAAVSSKIFLLHHPEGKEASYSAGTVKKYEDSDLHHISYSAYGSAGAPILNENHQVVAIHKGTGPFDETGKPLYKMGTAIGEIQTWLSKKRLFITV